MKVKKKLDGGLKAKIIILLFFFILSKNCIGSQILDYETEEFIYELIYDIIKVNNVNRKIKLKINNDNEINAYVDDQNIIHVNSGLIQYAEDYVALLSVLAHEIGHIDLNHIGLRKKSVEKNKKYGNLAILSVIAGSAVTQSPEFLQTSIVSSAAISNRYIEFSKEQEIEADLYALNTLSSLNTYSNSIIKLLNTIQQRLLQKGISKNIQRLSSHPYFEDRVSLINNYNKNKKNNINLELDQRFNFIKAKFIGYNDNNDQINYLKEPYKTYAESIRYAKIGNLKKSLENINEVISISYNSFIYETKADILFSYGYTNEAVKFYKMNLENYPLNFYSQIRIFENIDTENMNKNDIEIIFDKNKDLLFKYFNNKNILLKYLKLATKLDKNEWINFFEFILKIDQYDKIITDNQISNFKKTRDIDLKKFIAIFEEVTS